MTISAPDGGNLVHRFHLVLDQIVDLDQDEIERVEELVQVGEFAVALENLCSQLYEYDVRISDELVAAIAVLANTVGVEDRYWTVLRADHGAN